MRKPDLLERPRLVVGTKADAIQADELELLGWTGDIMSSVTRQGLSELVGKMAMAVHDARQAVQHAEGVVNHHPVATRARSITDAFNNAKQVLKRSSQVS